MTSKESRDPEPLPGDSDHKVVFENCKIELLWPIQVPADGTLVLNKCVMTPEGRSDGPYAAISTSPQTNKVEIIGCTFDDFENCVDICGRLEMGSVNISVIDNVRTVFLKSICAFIV